MKSSVVDFESYVKNGSPNDWRQVEVAHVNPISFKAQDGSEPKSRTNVTEFDTNKFTQAHLHQRKDKKAKKYTFQSEKAEARKVHSYSQVKTANQPLKQKKILYRARKAPEDMNPDHKDIELPNAYCNLQSWFPVAVKQSNI